MPACGDNAVPSRDASMPGNDILAVLNPPGDSIGLDFSGTARLRVHLTDNEGESIVGQPIRFSIVQNNSESAGGSSLSASTQPTNSIGVAEVDLLAGAERVNFRVEATTPNAPSVLFYIQVSDQGFSDIRIATAHEGPRDLTSYERVELRIYQDTNTRCDTIDFVAPPESLFPQRTQTLLGEESEFRNLAVGLGYTVIAWAEAGVEATVQATGCLHIAADRLRSGSAFQAELPVTDLPYKLPEQLVLNTEIGLESLAETLQGQDTWATLACPLGRAQLLLDCLADAQSPDALLDCQSDEVSVFAIALEGQRGTLDADGCRPETLPGGEDSLDMRLAEALLGWPSAEELQALIDGRNSALGTLLIQSQIESAGANVASHRLLSAVIDTAEVDLFGSSRPLVEVAVPVQLSSNPIATLENHGFTLRYGDIATEAFESLSLVPANISGLGDALGTELLGGVAIEAQTGCTALEAFVCGELALGASCADQCESIAPALDIQLAAWLADLASSGIDYRFAMQADVLDENQDLVVDDVTAGEANVTVLLATELQTIVLPATATGTTP
tara:strand:- start:32845 stop:34527 length:1683 start_codon:yes stop_codon:yes gene_type:complete